jgi:hypothetical protein
MIQFLNSISTRKFPLAFLAATLSLTSVLGLSTADACRDCPFPMKVGEGHWLMPNRKFEIIIAEISPQLPFHEMQIRLIDPVSRETVASGSAYIRKGVRDIMFAMKDKQGFPVQGEIHFLDASRNRLQVRFSCTSCSIGDLFD